MAQNVRARRSSPFSTSLRSTLTRLLRILSYLCAFASLADEAFVPLIGLLTRVAKSALREILSSSSSVIRRLGILFTQRMMDSPEPPIVFTDFWTLAYGALT